MSLLILSILIWLWADNATAQHRSLPGTPDEQCYVPGDIQAYPPTGCTNDVIYCGWDGDIANQHTFFWILHKNVCPSGEILNILLKCIPGKCGPQLFDPCTEDQLHKEVPYDIGKDCTPYSLWCYYGSFGDFDEEFVWLGWRCNGNETFDEESRKCVPGSCTGVIKPDPKIGEPCDFFNDFQNYWDTECGPDVFRCGFGETRTWELYGSQCDNDDIRNEFDECVPLPAKCQDYPQTITS